MAVALQGAAVPHRLIEVEGAGHAFGIEVNGRDLTPSLLEFLESTWKDKKE
jgi:hypothetical protein